MFYSKVKKKKPQVYPLVEENPSLRRHLQRSIFFVFSNSKTVVCISINPHRAV